MAGSGCFRMAMLAQGASGTVTCRVDIETGAATQPPQRQKIHIAPAHIYRLEVLEHILFFQFSSVQTHVVELVNSTGAKKALFKELPSYI